MRFRSRASYEHVLPEGAIDRYQLVVDREYYSVRRAQQVTKEVSYANLNEMPAIDIAKYLGNRRRAPAEAVLRTLIEHELS